MRKGSTDDRYRDAVAYHWQGELHSEEGTIWIDGIEGSGLYVLLALLEDLCDIGLKQE